MINKALINILMLIPMVGCSFTNQNMTTHLESEVTKTRTTDSAKSEHSSSSTTFDTISFPQASCGDKLPNESKGNILKIYPVFIDYSSKVNLQIIQTQYCQDAIQKYRLDKGKEVIQLASFISEERANKFKIFLENKLENVEVGEPIVRNNTQKSQTNQNQSKSTEAVAKAAQLSPEQVRQLKNIIFKDSLGKQHKVEAILPTYLPPGFTLDRFKVSSDESDGKKYEIIYKNASSDSFKIDTYVPGPGAGPPPYAPKLKEVSSPAFGQVIIGYKEFHKTSEKSSTEVIISASPPETDNPPENTPSDYGSSKWIYSLNSDTISLVEAVKIVESLSYLYPNEPRNLKFYNALTNDPEWAN